MSKFKVGDKVKVIEWLGISSDSYKLNAEGVVVGVNETLPFPIFVTTDDGSLRNSPFLERELQLTREILFKEKM